MKIAVLGATGQVGSRVVAEATRRGHAVTAVSRREPTTPLPAGAVWQRGDAGSPDDVAALAAGHDVVVSAVGPDRAPGGDPGAFVATGRALGDAVGTTRLAVVGGAGSLSAAPGVRLVDTAGFPDQFKAEALAHAEVLDSLRSGRPDLDWTYLSPAPELGEGERTGSYRVGADEPAGSFVSYADLALALVDELERAEHRRERWTVATR